jgi:hypothetical protein
VTRLCLQAWQYSNLDMESGGIKSADQAVSDTNLSVSALETSEYVTATASTPPSITTVDDVGPASTGESSSSKGVSERIERLMQVRSEYGSDVEFEIDASRDHWSELSVSTSDEDEGNVESDVEVFEGLRRKWGGFFENWGDRLVVGEKIAEGGQAEIFDAGWLGGEYVLKVFKEGYLLRDLVQQLPHGMLRNRPYGWSFYAANACLINGATLLNNGRFAFHMRKYWGDLRKLIDFRMQRKGNQSPPFTHPEVGGILLSVATGMQQLHKCDIVHRDLKASNVLVRSNSSKAFDPMNVAFVCDVADFECSVGVVGTGYWRAPEVLQGVRDHNIKPRLFTKKVDVYSYAMTCYEVITGCVPFEEFGGNCCYNVVIEGERPRLPRNVDPSLQTLLSRCWHKNPLERPSFDEIRECLMKIYPPEYSFEDKVYDETYDETYEEIREHLLQRNISF